MIVPVILSGGSGTRLWPLSSPELPKQFLPLVTSRTMFQETVLRLEGLAGVAPPIVVCNQSHGALVAAQLDEIGVAPGAIVLEPEGRNTAPAIAVAAMLASGSEPFGSAASGGDPKGSDPKLLILPADHVIADVPAFHAAVARAVQAAEAGRLVTFGIVPTHPETGYGYIEQGEAEADWWRVARFVEKPDAETAQRYLDSGRFLWNSGMFTISARDFLDELGKFAPEIISQCTEAVAGAQREGEFVRLGAAFLDSPSDSIDYAVMEKTDRAVVVPLDAGWSDVGSWAALHDATVRDNDGNVLRGPVVAESCRDSLIHATTRPVAAIGLDDIVVIETESAVLVMRKDRAQQVRAVSSRVRAQKFSNKKAGND